MDRQLLPFPNIATDNDQGKAPFRLPNVVRIALVQSNGYWSNPVFGDELSSDELDEEYKV